MDKFYCLYLDDYSGPSFTSWGKPYYGTLEDIQCLVDALAHNGKDHGLSITELIGAIRVYLAGNHGVTHHVGYQEVPLLMPVSLLGTRRLSQEHFSWEHTNIWGCIYPMRCDAVTVDLYWVSGPEGFSRVERASFDNLVYMGGFDSWRPLRDGFWGFPEMIKTDGDTCSIRLAVIDKRFKNRDAALEDMAAAHAVSDVNFKRICDDIFGNG